mgnify:CR=1 FL=1
MKPRRAAGATHSFRLSRTAADIVDRLSYPRKLGGKSQLISEAIIFYFSEGSRESITELKESRQWWMNRCQEIEGEKSSPPTPPRSSILTRIGQWITRKLS